MFASNCAAFPTYYLKPGEIYLSRDPAIITTVLGSCICVTMYYTHGRFAAICHAVMPSFHDARNKTGKNKNTFQYVDTSLEWMFNQFIKNGIKHNDIEVKLFGGAEMFTDTTQGRSPIAVGKKNVEMALYTLEQKRLKLKAYNVGGNKGRKVIFNTLTGEVFAKFVNKTDVAMTFADTRRKP